MQVSDYKRFLCPITGHHRIPVQYLDNPACAHSDHLIASVNPGNFDVVTPEPHGIRID